MVSANRLELLQIADAVAREKLIERDLVLEAMEDSLGKAARSRYGAEYDIRAFIDRQTGEIAMSRAMEVVEEVENHFTEISLAEARLKNPEAEVGAFITEPLPAMEFGRIAAQTAKQVIVQKVREAEREQVVEEYKEREGEMLSGLVKRVDRNGVYIDLGGNAEGFVAREQMVPREPVRPQDRIKALLTEVRSEPRGPQLFMTRTSPQFLVELFKIEVPEVGQGLIDILGAARDPGLRAKIAVRSNDSRIDAVGACVGMRGSRVQAVSNELAGERVDIILWDDNSAQFVVNAMSPAEVVSIVVDEDKHSMDIAVEEDKLSQAIGRGGQNIRLASELSGWELNVMTAADAEEKSESEMKELIGLFSKQLDVDEEVSLILVQEGFSTIEEVAYVPTAELVAIEEFDEGIVDELRSRARDVLLTQAIVQEEKIDEVEPAEDLLSLEGMEKGLAFTLASKGVVTREDLAELATDDLLEISEMDEEVAAALIMKARAHWFEEEEQA